MIQRLVRTAVALLCATAVAVLPAGPAHADRVRMDQWHLRYLKIAEVHRITQGAGLIVGVVDSGVEPHPDLQRNLLAGGSVVPGDSGDGRTDTDSHGTGMAGHIAAHGRGAEDGVLGVAPEAKILPVRIRSRDGTGGPDFMAQGIEFAVSRGARIINISSETELSPALVRAVGRARAKDVVIVASAGNRPDPGIIYPGRLEGVVAVGASDRSGEHAPVSVTGESMALLAPGVDIVRTGINGRYRIGNGTSDSAAIVSGAVALIRSKYPKLSAEEVVHRLTATATDKGPPGHDPEYGYGVLNIVAALTADVPPLAGGDGASPSATASATPGVPTSPSAVAATPIAAQEPASSRTTTIFVVVGVLVVAGAVLVLLLLRSRRRTTS